MDMIREEHLKDMENYIKKVCDEAKICGVTVEEIKELVELVYKEDMIE